MSTKFNMYDPTPLWKVKTLCGRHTLYWFEVSPNIVSPVLDETAPQADSIMLFGSQDEHGNPVNFFAPFRETVMAQRGVPFAYPKAHFKNSIPRVLEIFAETAGGAA